MGWIQVDDLSGEVIPTGHVHLLTLRLDDDEVRTWEVLVREDLETLLADLGEHLVRWSASPRPAPVDRDLVRALVHQELGAVAQDLTGACPMDPDGLHSQGCGCDQYADESAADTPDTFQPDESAQVSDPQPVDESAGNDIPVVRAGDAVNGHATDATVRAWAAHHGVPCSTTGGLKRWVKEAYARVHGGAPDEQTWVAAGIDPATWVDADGRTRARQGSTTPETPETAGRHSEEGPASDPWPPAGRAPADHHTSDGALGSGTGGEGAPVPDPASAGRAPEAAVVPTGDGDPTRPRPEQLDLARELAADGATPMTIVDRTGVSLADARKVHDQARRERTAR